MQTLKGWRVIAAASYVAAMAVGMFCVPGKAEAAVLEPLPTGWVREPSGGLTDVGLAATPFEGKVYAFAKGIEGHIWLQTYDPTRRAWLGAWQEVPGGGTTNVALAATATSDTLYLFAKGKDDKQVYVNKKRAGGGPLDGWSGWFAEHLPAGKSLGAVAAAATSRGAVYVFRTDLSNQIYYSQRGSQWGPWKPLSGFQSDKAPAAAYDGATDTVHVFGVNVSSGEGYGRRIFRTSLHTDTWSAWRPMRDNVLSSNASVAAASGAGRLHVFYKTFQNRIRALEYSSQADFWSGAADVKGLGLTDAAPAATFVQALPDGSSQYMLFVKGIETPGIYYSFFSDTDIVAEINTRAQFNRNTGSRSGSFDAYEYTTIGAIPGLTPGTTRPAELAIVVHGWDNDSTLAQTRFQRARASLRLVGYRGPVVGFSWDSDTGWGPSHAFGFDEGREIAAGNGRKLANFIDDFKSRCPDAKIHLMGHSMGARVVLEAIWALDHLSYYLWNRDLAGARIDDVHLLGAAVDNEEVQVNDHYGLPITHEVISLFNYYDSQDDILEFAYPPEEYDYALGEDGIEDRRYAPFNYRDVDVEFLIPHGGDDHFAYWGYRPEDMGDEAGTLPSTAVQQESVGAMPAVRSNFR